MKSYISRTMFLRLFIYSIIVIFFLNLIMGALTYVYFKSTIQKREVTQSQETLNQSKGMVESTIQEIQRTAMAISENIAVRKMLVLPAGQIGYTDAQAVIGMLNEKINSSNYLHSIYLYNEHIDKVISGDGVIDLDQFWDREMIERLQGEPPYDSWLEPHTISGFYTGNTKVITYALRIPEGDQADNYVIINIKMDPFYQMYIRLYQNTHNDVAILNPDGKTIIYNDNSAKFGAMEKVFHKLQSVGSKGWFTETIDGVEMFVSFIKSDFNDWLYIKAAPVTEVFKESKLILKVVVIISLMCLIAGFILVFLMSNRYYRPIYSFVQGIAGVNDGSAVNTQVKHRTDDLSVLRTTFHKLKEENENVREEMKRHEEILKDHFLLNLLLGRENDPVEIRHSVNYYELALPDTGYMVLLLHFIFIPGESKPSQEQHNLLIYQIKLICEQFLFSSGGGAVVSLDRRHMALIMPSGTDKALDADRNAKQTALQLTDRINKECLIEVTVGIGAYRRFLYEIQGSYNEAKEAILFENIAGEGSIISIRDIRLDYSGTREWMDFNRKIEQLTVEIKLGNLSGSVDKLAEILDEIAAKTEVNYREKQVFVSQLVYAVITTMIELNPSLRGMYDGDPYVDYNRITTMDQVKEWLRATTIHAVSYIKDKRDNKNVELIGKICEYIQSRYAEELTLQRIAEQALMNPQYFSKIFKEVTSKTFLEYLTEVRLAEAVKLLRVKDAKIYEIAEKSGFGNKINLMRAFKKYYNMTPSEYRNQHIEFNK